MSTGASDPLGTLGEDLVLLSVLPHDGQLANPRHLAFALMGSELVRLAAAGRITIERGRIAVADPAPCGDAELDTALRSLARPSSPPRAKDWVGQPRKRLCEACLARLAATGALQAGRRPRLGVKRTTRWRIADPGRLAAARARLTAIAQSEGPVDAAQAAFAGLAHAAGLGMRFYPGWDNRHLRDRLEQIARNKVPATSPDAGASATAAAATTGASAAVRKAAWAAQQTAVQASNQAVMQWLWDDSAAAAAHHPAGYGDSTGHAGGGHAGGGHGF